MKKFIPLEEGDFTFQRTDTKFSQNNIILKGVIVAKVAVDIVLMAMIKKRTHGAITKVFGMIFEIDYIEYHKY